jgi:hypothetical protein
MDLKELARQYREKVEAEIRRKPIQWAPRQPLDFRVMFRHDVPVLKQESK